SDSGMPFGLQLMSNHFEEKSLLEMSKYVFDLMKK
ncbi:MAG: Asp-tRNA(Asn)/Glu-tRNA(Gln) amidotransferase A subunit family amidase, partial [bacterium]